MAENPSFAYRSLRVEQSRLCTHKKLKLGFCSPFAFKFADKVRKYRWNSGLSFSCVNGHIRATFQEMKKRKKKGGEETGRDKHTEERWMRTRSRDEEKERDERSWETERKWTEGRKREIGADGTDGRGRAANEMRLGRSPAKAKCISCSRVSWWCKGKLLYVCLREA